ncbi:MAG: glutaredoxin family protein, partial [Candidatus Polarisedimenticolia bacterium]
MRDAAHPGSVAVLYTRALCPLCFVMHRAAARAARRHGAALRIIDIGGDAGLEARYGDTVPVLVLPDVTFSSRADARAIEA